MTDLLLRTSELFSDWVEPWGWPGMIAMLGLFAVGAASFLPRPLLCVVAGITYGYWGLAIAFAGTLAGASLAFAFGSAFSPRIASWSARRPRVKQVLEAVRSEGWKAVLLLRLAPLMPSSIQSILFGLGGIPFSRFFLATAIGIAPGVLLEVMIGVTGSMIAAGHFHRVHLLLSGLGLLAGCAAVVLIARRARAMLRDHQPDHRPE